jgi:hypothetical protein
MNAVPLLRCLTLACALVPVWAPPRQAHAGGPTTRELAGESDFAKGTLEALTLGADGILRVGARFAATPLDAPTAWSGARSGDALWVGCGNDASLRRVVASGAPEVVALGDGLMVTALAPLSGGGVAAAVFPGGRLVRVSAEREVAPLATLEAEHVWALLPGRDGSLVAATGVPGALWRVASDGAVTKLCDVDDEHARCLGGSDGALLVGTGGKGRVLAYDGTALKVVRDLAQDEVVGVVRLADGSLVVAANSDAGGGNAQQLSTLLRQLAQPPATRGEQKAQERSALQDGTLLHLEASGAVTTLWEGKKTALLALVPDGAGVAAGTYPSGRVLRAVPGRKAEVLADLPEAEASVLVSGAAGLEAVVTSNPAVLHRPGTAAAEGRFTSAPLEAGALARWGALRVVGRGVTGARFRAGETDEPDASWGAWTASAAFDGGSGATGVTARYLQLELTLTGADAEVQAVSVVAQAPNHAPGLSDFSFAPAKSKGDGDGPSAKRTIGWKVEDADGDTLLTSVEVQRVGSTRWAPVVKEQTLDKPGATWDTTGLPDGLYRVRITVSDAPSNPVDRARSAVLEGPPQRVDNSAPSVKAGARLEGARLVLEGEAVDAARGRIAEVRVSLDGGPWLALAASDGLLDGPLEAFHAALPLPLPGDHDLVVQALDADGNVGAAGVTVNVPATR